MIDSRTESIRPSRSSAGERRSTCYADDPPGCRFSSATSSAGDPVAHREFCHSTRQRGQKTILRCWLTIAAIRVGRGHFAGLREELTRAHQHGVHLGHRSARNAVDFVVDVGERPLETAVPGRAP